jgi:hypothetical protein
MTLMEIDLLEVAWVRCNCLYAFTCFFLIEHRVNSVDIQLNKILTVCYAQTQTSKPPVSKKKQSQRVANDQMPKSDHFRVVVVLFDHVAL